jgi:hypothetical protein
MFENSIYQLFCLDITKETRLTVAGPMIFAPQLRAVGEVQRRRLQHTPNA